jgi:UDP-N-acetylglucosamine diphosphorylase/glucosamine-1-phosphate N-acetyltransferase
MHFILSDCDAHSKFAPLTLTRPIAELRTGIFTNVERWKLLCDSNSISFETEDYLSELYPKSQKKDPTWVNAAVILSTTLYKEISELKTDQALFHSGDFIAYRGEKRKKDYHNNIIQTKSEPVILKERWHLFQQNETILKQDFEWITKNKMSQSLSSSNTLIGPLEHLFIEEGAEIEGAVLNTKSGPIYIGKNAEIMEGSTVRGGLALCDNATLKMSSKIYGATTIGPHCKVGGEVNNSIFQAYSNKGHDGFLGNSLVGEWCNLGADTNTSNLKSNYGKIKTYTYLSSKIEQTSEIFMGVAMGDHSKTSINTMLNTATVIGVSAMIFGDGFPPKYIPSFSWSGFSKERFKFEKAIEMADNMMKRRGKSVSDKELKVLKYISNSY